MALFNNIKPTSTAAAAATVATAAAAISTAWPLFRSLSLVFLSFLLRLVDHILSRLFPPPPSFSPFFSSSSSPTTRALSHLLSLISFIPISSQKYHFARALADRLLDENLFSSLAGGGLRDVNCAALLDAFERRMRRLEAVVGDEILGWRRLFGAAEKEGGGGGVVAEKVAGEVVWLAEKMDECGAVGEAVARWATAAELGRSALNVDGRIQVAFVRVSVFLIRNAHRMQAELCHQKHDEYDELTISISECCMSMLRTWLPLLCRAGNGVGTPILNNGERIEMARVLDEMIQKLNLAQQEEILGLWLHHFTSCPDSDWPNLESTYTRWYAMSRKIMLQ